MAVRFFQLFSLLTLAAGKPILFPRQASDAPQVGGNEGQGQGLVDVKLYSLGNSTVRAHVTNVGNEGLRLVRSGSILDGDHPTKKVAVSGDKENPIFNGAEVTYINSHLSPDAFVHLAPNQTIESIFDIANSHDLSPGEKYSAIADGTLEYTRSGNPKKFSVVPYKSNEIRFDAPESITKDLSTRSTLESCDGEYSSLVKKALERAAKMATAGANDARNGTSSLFEKFFMSTDESDRKEVAERLDAIAKEATSKGVLTYYCQPSAQDSCGGNIAAVTYPTEDRVVNCQGYYESTEVSDTCNYLDQAAISLHEFSHATSVYDPGTEDVAYGYDSVLQLSTKQALNNADSFAYYASAVFLNCDGSDDSNTIPGTGGSGSDDDGTITLPWDQGTDGSETGGDSSSGSQTETGSGTGTTPNVVTVTSTVAAPAGNGNSNGNGQGGNIIPVFWPLGGSSQYEGGEQEQTQNQAQAIPTEIAAKLGNGWFPIGLGSSEGDVPVQTPHLHQGWVKGAHGGHHH
ncbi:hypothetical protein P170DRAFT_441707 [Aspergillus steynii IBT 23096]|uniref:Neutral protease 2 n=1 Tax=Aspergillus steynii IBT 23096 TaxID=1392250 RepID=A0A2I2FRJ3_9EURO|nr:uncharacterized protein P170DRAFT_441707 [Aspergillus steynii IBT 23096]PLB43252.1 hypothetical protein P170DRAFT_441707 [Aspergillus steynii IBT 23096]